MVHVARCRCVGISPNLDSALGEAALESRAEARRLGLRTLNDRVGLLGAVETSSTDLARKIWITGGQRSGWLSDLLSTERPADGAAGEHEIVVASRSSGRQLIGVSIGQQFGAFSVRDMSLVRSPPSVVAESTRSLQRVSRMEVLVSYFVLADDGWAIANVTPHLPPWLEGVPRVGRPPSLRLPLSEVDECRGCAPCWLSPRSDFSRTQR